MCPTPRYNSVTIQLTPSNIHNIQNILAVKQKLRVSRWCTVFVNTIEEPAGQGGKSSRGKSTGGETAKRRKSHNSGNPHATFRRASAYMLLLAVLTV